MSETPQADNPFLTSVETLLDAITFDDSGFNGAGGNGGLLSRETIRKASLVRLELSRVKAASGMAPVSGLASLDGAAGAPVSGLPLKDGADGVPVSGLAGLDGAENPDV